MRLVSTVSASVLVALLWPTTYLAQSSQPAPTLSQPRLVNLSGIFQPANGQPAAGVHAVTLAIYTEETGGSPVWEETQSVAVDAEGRYTLLIGATQTDGLPLGVFASGEAQWLGITFQGEAEGPRLRFTSVPYALHAADAATLGGQPASAYMLNPEVRGATEGTSSTASTAAAAIVTDPVTVQAVLPGTTNALAKYVNAADVGASTISEVSGRLGINTGAAALPLDFMHVRYNDQFGAFTGLAVQNMNAGANAAAGMSVYDQNGALSLFQGFNNTNHAYVINNIATGGSINFALGSSSRFFVDDDDITLRSPAGRVNLIGTGDPAGFPFPNASIKVGLNGALGQTIGWTPGFGNPGVWVEGSSCLSGCESSGFYGDGDTAALWSPGDTGNILSVYDEDALPAGAAAFVVQASGNIRVGYGTNGCVADADGTVIAGACSSDERLKKEIRPFDSGMLERALKLHPVFYRWREELMGNRLGPNPGESYGFIAQEVEKIYPEMVSTGPDGYKAVDYTRLPFVLLGALQEEHAKVQSLEARLARLESARWTNSLWGALAGVGLVGLAFYRRQSDVTR